MKGHTWRHVFAAYGLQRLSITFIGVHSISSFFVRIWLLHPLSDNFNISKGVGKLSPLLNRKDDSMLPWEEQIKRNKVEDKLLRYVLALSLYEGRSVHTSVHLSIHNASWKSAFIGELLQWIKRVLMQWIKRLIHMFRESPFTYIRNPNNQSFHAFSAEFIPRSDTVRAHLYPVGLVDYKHINVNI